MFKFNITDGASGVAANKHEPIGIADWLKARYEIPIVCVHFFGMGLRLQTR
jgi:hypothetical protein